MVMRKFRRSLDNTAEQQQQQQNGANSNMGGSEESLQALNSPRPSRKFRAGSLSGDLVRVAHLYGTIVILCFPQKVIDNSLKERCNNPVERRIIQKLLLLQHLLSNISHFVKYISFPERRVRFRPGLPGVPAPPLPDPLGGGRPSAELPGGGRGRGGRCGQGEAPLGGKSG